jgi:hypothetical protein
MMLQPSGCLFSPHCLYPLSISVLWKFFSHLLTDLLGEVSKMAQHIVVLVVPVFFPCTSYSVIKILDWYFLLLLFTSLRFPSYEFLTQILRPKSNDNHLHISPFQKWYHLHVSFLPKAPYFTIAALFFLFLWKVLYTCLFYYEIIHFPLPETLSFASGSLSSLLCEFWVSFSYIELWLENWVST